MEVPCVRVRRADGERARSALDAADCLDRDHEIVVDGALYVPVADPDAALAALPGDLAATIVERSVPARETQTTPADLVGFEPSYERVGDVAVIDEDDPDRARALADAIVDSDIPLGTVLNRASKVKGTHRVRDWEVIAGSGTETVHREYGCAYAVDLASVYFSPRLATERHRVAEQVEEGEQAVDMFAGVGPFVIPFAKRGATAVGVDINPDAVVYMRANAERNGVTDRVTAIEGDVRTVAADYGDWADRIVMNLPHSAEEFLDAAVEIAGETCTLHYYDIQPETDPFAPGEAAVRAAADGYDVMVVTRREVRSYSPEEVNVCLDLRLER
ncbi:SAM-dependent methyltransferase [Halobacteriales archaeon SW_7_68_16]|nr:MAG: SAM-dependent methyltransferase [Halobacteriales archaeon SW_7_68_16]